MNTSMIVRSALLLALVASPVGALGATYSDTQPLVLGTAVFDPFDSQGGSRVLNFATISVDLGVDVLTDPISNLDSLANPTEIDLELEAAASWAPDNRSYHSDPTDSGLDSQTFVSRILIPGQSNVVHHKTHLLPTMSYRENTYDFDEQYGVDLLSAIVRQKVTVASGAGMINPFGTSVTFSGDVTVEYDYSTLVPEPSSALMLFSLLLGLTATKRRAL